MTSLTYRLFEEGDLPELLQLWEQEAGWGTLTADAWRERFLTTPAGSGTIVVAIDSLTNKIAGQFIFIPSIIYANGRELLAARPYAPVIARSVRSPLNTTHPIFALYFYAVELLQKQGVALTYMLPNPHWSSLLRLFPMFQRGAFPLWSLPLPCSEFLPLPAGYTVGSRPPTDAQVNDLWRASAPLHACQIKRDADYLFWKFGQDDYTLTTIERGGKLVGLVSALYKGDRQWLLCDLLMADATDALHAVLIAATNQAHHMALVARSDKPIKKAAILCTPLLEPVVHSLGYRPDAYTFPFIIHLLDESIQKNEVNPAAWYLSATD